jgi:hypothetical protein
MKLQIILMTLLLSVLFCAPRCAIAQSQELSDADLKDVVIAMKQENHCGCTNCCAVYSVSISGDGIVTYKGINAVNIIGEQVYSISIDQVKALVAEFYKADFFSLKDSYTSKDNGNGMYISIDHSAPVTTSITIKGKTKSVYNFYGAPEKLIELQERVYEISQIGLYVKPS